MREASGATVLGDLSTGAWEPSMHTDSPAVRAFCARHAENWVCPDLDHETRIDADRSPRRDPSSPPSGAAPRTHSGPRPPF